MHIFTLSCLDIFLRKSVCPTVLPNTKRVCTTLETNAEAVDNKLCQKDKHVLKEGRMEKHWMMKMQMVMVVMLMVSTMSGCGSGGGKSGDGPASGNPSSLSVAKAVGVTEDCLNGGIEVDSGIDANGNEILDDSEISVRQTVCHGENGMATLVAMVDEPVGDNCSGGGIRVNVGNDGNRDGILQDSEIANHDYICRGADGAPGRDAHPSLVRIETLTDGIRISSGLDENDNGVLDDAEILTAEVVKNGEPGPGITWETVTDNQVQAQPNTGYIANSASRVTVTLPAEPSVGDIVEISGAGTGGWKIVQNEGQRIITKNIRAYREWAARDAKRLWSSVALWDGGMAMAATDENGSVYLSSDYGSTWAEQTGLYTVRINGGENKIAAMEDGSALGVAVIGGRLFTYSFAVDRWTLETVQNCTSVAYASDAGHFIYSLGAGAVYVQPPGSGPSSTRVSDVTARWTDVASSSDGSLIAAVASASTIFISTDEGLTWSPREMRRDWNRVAVSAGGRILAATVERGKIYISSDYGNTWTERSQDRLWSSVAVSADGTRLVAAVRGGKIFTSSNGGVSWAEHDAPLAEGDTSNWTSVAISPDGTHLTALARGGHIYTSEFTNTIFSSTSGTSGYMTGEQYDSIKLQYVGNNTFSILYHQGDDFVVR